MSYLFILNLIICAIVVILIIYSSYLIIKSTFFLKSDLLKKQYALRTMITGIIGFILIQISKWISTQP